ncbi:MAG TPA: hypothetical protein VGS22_17670 [Thermoanaerobaculia bacterium]|nr:hypothetical protein [Thermoanaerobaculia bacterium]
MRRWICLDTPPVSAFAPRSCLARRSVGGMGLVLQSPATVVASLASRANITTIDVWNVAIGFCITTTELYITPTEFYIATIQLCITAIQFHITASWLRITSCSFSNAEIELAITTSWI